MPPKPAPPAQKQVKPSAPKQNPPPAQKQLQTSSSKQIQPPAQKQMQSSPSMQSMKTPPIAASKTVIKPLQVQGSKTSFAQRKSFAVSNKVAQAPPASPKAQQGGKLSTVSAPVLPKGQGQGQQRQSIAVSQKSGMGSAMSVSMPVINREPPRMSIVSYASSNYNANAWADKGRSYSVRVAPRATHYDLPSDKAWRQHQPPIISPLAPSHSSTWIYRKWNALEPVTFVPVTKEQGYTGKERFGKFLSDCKVCCKGQGPRKDNPCACFMYSITQGAYGANFVSVMMSLVSMIFEMCRITNPDEKPGENELIIYGLHIGACVFLLASSILLFYGMDKFKIYYCLPWVVCEYIMIVAYLYWFIPFNFWESSKAGQSVHIVYGGVAILGLGIHIYIAWVISTFVYNVKYKKLGPNTPNPFFLDADDLLLHPDFDQVIV